MKNTLRFAGLLLLAVALGAATTPPKPRTTVNPSYPAELTDTGLNGGALINLLVKADGTVGETSVKSADNPAFGVAALEAVKGWTFEPATKDGAPVDIHVTLPFKFTAPTDQVLNALMHRRVYRDLPETPLSAKEYGAKLKVKRREAPRYPPALVGSSTDEKVQVKFVIGPEGSTFNPVVEGKPRKEFVVPALTAVAHTTYEPPMKDGHGVYVETTTTVRFSDPADRARGGGGDFGGGGGGFGGGGGGGGRDFGGGDG